MRTAIKGVFVLSACVALATVTSLGSGAIAQTRSDAELDGILGFDLGEERRYIAGPPGAIRDDGRASWSVRLDQVVMKDSRKVGIFVMTHEQSSRGLSLKGTIRVHWKYEGELLLNEFGFPEALRYWWYEEHTGEAPWRGERVFSSYTFEDGEYRKIVRLPDQDWEFNVPIASHGPLDLDVPEGLFLFRSRPAGVDYFTNPALLDFAVPAAIPERWKQRTLFLRPTIPARYPAAGWIRAERDRQGNLGRSYDKITLEARDETVLEIAGRTLRVRRLSIGGPMGDAYIDDFGRIVRIDLDIDSQTRKDRWVRLLFPSEY